MSRFNCDEYDDDGPPPAFWWQSVRNALKGKRGQAVLRELKQSILELPQPRLIEGAAAHEGDCCALGALALHRMKAGEEIKCYGRSLRTPEDLEAMGGDLEDELGTVELGEGMGLKRALAWIIAYENDEGGRWKETAEARYHRMLGWIEQKLQ